MENEIFSKELNRIGFVLGLTSSQLNDFGDKLFEMAKTAPQNHENASKDLIKAALRLSYSNLSSEDIIKIISVALILTRKCEVDVMAATESIIATLNTFKGCRIDNATSKFANVDAAFAVSSADLVEGLERVKKSANEASLQIDNLTKNNR